VHDGLAGPAARLGELTGDVRALCERAQAEAPSAGLEVPGAAGGRYLDAHRALSRAAALAAQAAQAATMARVCERAGDSETARERVRAAARAVGVVEGHVRTATQLLGEPRAEFHR
jgi:hypothetical protein